MQERAWATGRNQPPVLLRLPAKADLGGTHSTQPGDVDKTESNCKKINNLVGYSPKVDIKVGMDHFIDWYMEFYKND